MDQPWQIELFGWLQATRGDQVVSRFRTQRAGSLLAYLAYHCDRSHPREALIERLWPESDPHLARASLRTELNSLRRQLEPPGVPAGAVLLATRATLRLNPEACRIDVSVFEAALHAAAQAQSPAAQAQQLATAASLYRGELLPDCFEAWIMPERQRLAEAFLQAVHELVGLLEALCDLPGALQWARRAVAADPLGEESHHRLIRLLLASGQMEAARDQFEQGEGLLLRELGVGLAPEIRGLVRDVALVKGRPPTAPGGKRGHRSEATQGRNSPAGPEPEHRPAAPPAAGEAAVTPSPQWSAAAAPRRNHNLPLRFTRFFGREHEIEQLCELLCPWRTADSAPQSDSEPIQNPNAQRAPEIQNRLITMTGPGGTGKTRLALQVAQQLRNAFPGGVWFASLRELTDPALIPDQILLALRLARSPESEALQQVVAFLSQAPALLVLDNYEHLVEGGAEWARQLLERVEHLTLLVTSRRCLGLEGEREFPVVPLPMPGVQDRQEQPDPNLVGPERPNAERLNALAACPSVALFVDRAQAVRPDFQVTAGNALSVSALCRRLEGLPLAIELAAARSRAVTPQQMLRQLEAIHPFGGSLPSEAGARSVDPLRGHPPVPGSEATQGGGRFELLVSRQRPADPRHHSLRATLDWSYQLLSPELQRFFARLSVFRGGWTVEAAEAVCGDRGVRCSVFGIRCLGSGDPIDPTDLAPTPNTQHLIPALEYLEQLRECSLVQATEAAGEMRFHLLETLREYGAEQLAAEERAELARQHAHFFLALAETAETELCRADQVLWLDRLEQELDNLRAALDWALGCQPSAISSDTESRRPTADGPLELGLRLGSALERFWETRGHVKEGRTQLLRLLAAPGPPAHPPAVGTWVPGEARVAPTAVRARALGTAGMLTSLQDDVKLARTLLEESLALWRRLEDLAGIAAALLHLGSFEAARWEYASAFRRAEECLALRRELGEPAGLADALELAAMVRDEANDPQARVLLEESIAIWRALGDRISTTRGLANLAHLTMCEGDLDTSRRLHEEVLAAATELGDRPRIAWALFGLGEVAYVQEDYPTARAFYERSLPLWQELDDKHGLMKTRFYLGHTLMRQGDPAAAYERFAEILAIARGTNRHGAAAEALAFLGATAGDLGRWEETAARCTASLELCRAGELETHHLAIEWNLIEVARVALVRGKPARAARLLGAAEALLGPVPPARRRELDSAASAARAQMEAAEFEAAWAAGQAAPLEQIIGEALREGMIPWALANTQPGPGRRDEGEELTCP